MAHSRQQQSSLGNAQPACPSADASRVNAESGPVAVATRTRPVASSDRMRPRIRELSSMCLLFRIPCALSHSRFETSSMANLLSPSAGNISTTSNRRQVSRTRKSRTATARDVDLAVAAAEKAFADWSRKPAAERSQILLRIADLIERDLEKLARAESIDTGKPIIACAHARYSARRRNFRFFATAILHTESEAHITDDVAFNYTLRQPRGIAGLISPWNLPLYLLSWKIAPAIAVGNTAIAKPSELTPMTAFIALRNCREAGLPNGVLNVVHGTGPNVGAAITAHPKITHDLVYRRHGYRKQSSRSVRAVIQEGFARSSAAKIRTSFSPTPISTPPSPAACARLSPTRDRFVCAARAYSSSAPSTKILSIVSSIKRRKLKDRRSARRENRARRDREQSAAR